MSIESRRSIKSSQLKMRTIELFTKAGTNAQSFLDAAVTAAADTIGIAGHGFITGDRVQVANSGGALPTGLSAATDYWVIKVSDDAIKLATSLANAIAGTAVDITGAAGGGTHTVTNTDELSGPARLRDHVLQVQSTGTYKITFDPATPFPSAADYAVLLTPSTADVVVRVKEQNAAHVIIEVKENDDVPAVADGFFHIIIIGSETSNRW